MGTIQSQAANEFAEPAKESQGEAGENRRCKEKNQERKILNGRWKKEGERADQFLIKF